MPELATADAASKLRPRRDRPPNLAPPRAVRSGTAASRVTRFRPGKAGRQARLVRGVPQSRSCSVPFVVGIIHARVSPCRRGRVKTQATSGPSAQLSASPCARVYGKGSGGTPLFKGGSLRLTNPRGSAANADCTASQAPAPERRPRRISIRLRPATRRNWPGRGALRVLATKRVD